MMERLKKCDEIFEDTSVFVYLHKNEISIVTANGDPYEVGEREKGLFESGGSEAVKQHLGEYCASKAEQAIRVVKLLRKVYFIEELK